MSHNDFIAVRLPVCARYSLPLTSKEYDPVTDSWRDRAPLPYALDHMGGKTTHCVNFAIENGGGTN